MKDFIELHNAFKDIIFIEDGHRYIWKNNKDVTITSVTSLINKYKQSFNVDFYSRKKATELGVSVIDVLRMWDEERIHGSTKGSIMHEGLEYYWQNKRIISTVDTSDVVDMDRMRSNLRVISKQTTKFYDDFKDRYVPVKLEMIVGDKDYNIAGQFDGLFYDTESEHYVLLDYKNDKKFTKTQQYGKNFRRPITNVAECEFNKYSLQLSLYRYIIEKNTNIKIGEMVVYRFNEKLDNYEEYKLNYLKEEVFKVLEHYKKNK